MTSTVALREVRIALPYELVAAEQPRVRLAARQGMDGMLEVVVSVGVEWHLFRGTEALRALRRVLWHRAAEKQAACIGTLVRLKAAPDLGPEQMARVTYTLAEGTEHV